MLIRYEMECLFCNTIVRMKSSSTSENLGQFKNKIPIEMFFGMVKQQRLQTENKSCLNVVIASNPSLNGYKRIIQSLYEVTG